MSYKVILETADLSYKGQGDTLDEAIADLGLSWENIKAHGTMKVNKDGTSVEHMFHIRQLKRIFANKMTRYLWAKRLDLLLNEKL